MSLRSRFFTPILCVFACVAVAWNDEPQVPSSTPTATTTVLLFRSGRTVEGEITQTKTHYVVVQPVGKVEVLKGDVELVAKNIEAVYRFKLDRINDSDPDEHIRLAQWCVLVNLRERAIEELERAAELSSNPDRVKGMLESLRRTVPANKSSNQGEANAVKPDQPIRTYPSFQKEVTPDHVSNFSIQIQPLLVRSCATTGCHDVAHQGSLSLRRSSMPSQKITQQNLRAVLAHVNPDEPDASAILAQALRPHGKIRQSPLARGPNDPAFLTLADWVRSVSGKPSPKPTSIPDTGQSLAANQPTTKPTTPSAGDATPSKTAIYSNTPFVETPARIRAGMIPATAANPPQAPLAPDPLANGRDNATAGHPLMPRPPAAGIPESPTDHKTAATDAESKRPAPDRAPAGKPNAKPKANKPTAEDYQPVDPFDPEIFNRHFSPRGARQGP